MVLFLILQAGLCSNDERTAKVNEIEFMIL